jgi:hypothetical protein
LFPLRQYHGNGIACRYITARNDDRHNPGLPDEIAF